MNFSTYDTPTTLRQVKRSSTASIHQLPAALAECDPAHLLRGFLAKPFRSRVLLEAIRAVIDRGRAAGKGRAEIEVLRQCYEELTPHEREVLPPATAGRIISFFS